MTRLGNFGVIFGHLSSKKETESEDVNRLRTCNREAVQAAADSKKQQQATVASERNSASGRVGGSKRATECKRAGGAGVSMTTSVFSASFKNIHQESTKKTLTPNEAPAGTLEA